MVRMAGADCAGIPAVLLGETMEFIEFRTRLLDYKCGEEVFRCEIQKRYIRLCSDGTVDESDDKKTWTKAAPVVDPAPN